MCREIEHRKLKTHIGLWEGEGDCPKYSIDKLPIF